MSWTQAPSSFGFALTRRSAAVSCCLKRFSTLLWLAPGAVVLGVRFAPPQRRGLLLLEALLDAALAGAAARDGVDETAVGGAADAEQHEAAAHEEGERHVDHLDGVAAAAAAEVEEH